MMATQPTSRAFCSHSRVVGQSGDSVQTTALVLQINTPIALRTGLSSPRGRLKLINAKRPLFLFGLAPTAARVRSFSTHAAEECTHAPPAPPAPRARDARPVAMSSAGLAAPSGIMSSVVPSDGLRASTAKRELSEAATLGKPMYEIGYIRILLSCVVIMATNIGFIAIFSDCLLYTSPSPRDKRQSRMPSSA